MEGWFAFIAFSNLVGSACTSLGDINTSVEPHQTITSRCTPLSFLNCWMSSLISSARSNFVLALFTCVPLSRLTYAWSNAAFIGRMPLSKPFTSSRCRCSSTPALTAASYAVSGKMSQPPNTRLSSLSSGTKSRISGEWRWVRLPRRMVPSWVTEPIGCAQPLRTSSTPAMNVVLTAPMPGVRTPSSPFGGSMLLGRRISTPPTYPRRHGAKRSLVTQRLDGVQPGRLPRRIKAEEDAHRPGKAKGNENRFWLDQEVPLGEVGNAVRPGQAKADPDQPSDEGQAEGFDQELAQHVSAAGPHCHPQPNLPSSLRHGNQHDVHDPDASDEERDRGDGGQEHGQNPRRLFLGLQDFREVAQPEVVGVRRLEAMALTKEGSDLLLGFFHRADLADFDRHGIHGT